jgi:hypothetical protein
MPDCPQSEVRTLLCGILAASEGAATGVLIEE